MCILTGVVSVGLIMPVYIIKSKQSNVKGN